MADEDPDDGKTFKVGYGKPPKHTRFKKGQSGNPKGRPRKVAESPPSVNVSEILSELVAITDHTGKKRKVSSAEAILRKQLQKGLAGNVQSLKRIARDFKEHGMISAEILEESGPVVVPNSMPLELGAMLLVAHGRPPWRKQDVKKMAPYYIAQLSEEERALDREWGYEDLKGFI